MQQSWSLNTALYEFQGWKVGLPRLGTRSFKAAKPGNDKVLIINKIQITSSEYLYFEFCLQYHVSSGLAVTWLQL